MGYTFKGFFTRDEPVASAAKARWPFCQLKSATEQVSCFILRCPDENDLPHTAAESEFDAICAQYVSVEEGLPGFSAEHPGHVLVYLEVDCFGGVCMYSGFHVRDGAVIRTFDAPDAPPNILKDILSPLEVRWGDNLYFAPLTRGYFPRVLR